jgi:peptide/nickel transport system permease protein
VCLHLLLSVLSHLCHDLQLLLHLHLLVFLPLMTAINMLTEAALSFLSIGVQPPDASWGTIVNDGVGLLYTRPWVAIAPGIMLAITAVALNLLGDGVREALDPKAKLRGGA